MTTTFLNQLGIVPALFIALAGIMILRGEDQRRSARRFLLFLLGVGVIILLALVLTTRLVNVNDSPLYFQLAWLSAPSILGILALILLNGRAGLAGMDRRTRLAAGSLVLAMIILFILNWNPQFGIEFYILPGVLILTFGWALGKRWNWLAIVLSLMGLGMLEVFNYYVGHPPDYSASPPPFFLMILFFLGYNIWPALSVVMSGVLITASFHSSEAPRLRQTRLFLVGLAFALILFLAYVVFWGSVWDHTSDGLSGLFLSQLSGIIAVGTGMIMILALRGRSRLAGLLFMLVVPILLNQAFEAGWCVSYHAITEARAARIARALEQFHAREGYYPETLDMLTPRDLLFIQQPVILAGEEWCYQGGADYYRLSAFYREYFSLPVSLRIYAAAGVPPAGSWTCEERLAEMKQKYYSPVEDTEAMRPPAPTPLPEIEVEIPKTEIQPLLNGAAALPGSWSPDSTYFVLGTQTDSLTLHFLNGKTGEICTEDGQFAIVDRLREHHAWLPDGRLLYVGSSGEIVVRTPCQSGGEGLSDRYSETFTQIASYSPENGRALLKSNTAYWILDGSTLTAQFIEGVTPNPYEAHWDTFAWLPHSNRLVINRLNGRGGSEEGSTLYVINSDTVQVEKSLPVEGDFGQSASWIEGLGEHELLMHGMGEILIIDFSADPTKVTNALTDIFGLDIRYPDDVSAAGSFADPEGSGYYLAMRLNHPRNQATYLYDSQTRRVYEYDHEYHTLLLFANGQLAEMAKWEDVPMYQDIYDVVLVGAPEAVQPQLVLTGHTPREYPHLSLVYLEERSQLAVASAHGVSLVSLPDGKMETFWTLPGDGYSPWLIAAPDDSALVAAKDFGGLYYIPLPPGQ